MKNKKIITVKLGKKVKKSNVVKRNIKASVFTHLFSIPKYRKEMYLCLHPKDRGIKEKDLKDYTISSILTNIQVNDLGILVGNLLLLRRSNCVPTLLMIYGIIVRMQNVKYI